jgi:hypothetical protein
MTVSRKETTNGIGGSRFPSFRPVRYSAAWSGRAPRRIYSHHFLYYYTTRFLAPVRRQHQNFPESGVPQHSPHHPCSWKPQKPSLRTVVGPHPPGVHQRRNASRYSRPAPGRLFGLPSLAQCPCHRLCYRLPSPGLRLPGPGTLGFPSCASPPNHPPVQRRDWMPFDADTNLTVVLPETAATVPLELPPLIPAAGSPSQTDCHPRLSSQLNHGRISRPSTYLLWRPTPLPPTATQHFLATHHPLQARGNG